MESVKNFLKYESRGYTSNSKYGNKAALNELHLIVY